MGISKEEFEEICIAGDCDGEEIMGVAGCSKHTVINKYYTNGLRKKLGTLKNLSTYFPPKKKDFFGFEEYL